MVSSLVQACESPSTCQVPRFEVVFLVSRCLPGLRSDYLCGIDSDSLRTRLPEGLWSIPEFDVLHGNSHTIALLELLQMCPRIGFVGGESVRIQVTALLLTGQVLEVRGLLAVKVSICHRRTWRSNEPQQ